MQQRVTSSVRLTARVVAGAMVMQVLMASPGLAQTVPALDDGAQMLAQRAAAGTWDTFTAKVTIHRQWVSAAGAPVGPQAPNHEYVWERELTDRGWTSRMTVVDRPGPTVRTRQGDLTLPPGPIAEKTIARMEHREDGSAPRFFNRAGVELRPSWQPPRGGAQGVGVAAPGIDAAWLGQAGVVSSRPAFGREWVQSFVILPGRSATRMQSVTKGYGRRAGWVRGYGRYVRDDGPRQLELLIDEQDGVPVEANVVEQGSLRSHTTFRYERSLTGALVRRGVRVEAEAPSSSAVRPSSAARVVTDVTYSEVRLLTKGGR